MKISPRRGTARCDALFYIFYSFHTALISSMLVVFIPVDEQTLTSIAYVLHVQFRMLDEYK